MPTNAISVAFFLRIASHGLDPQLDIGTIESRHDDARLRQPEKVHDVVANFRGRRGRECRHRRPAGTPVAATTAGGAGFQAPVVGPEIVAPLRHAVRLVNDEPGDRHVAQESDEVIGREPLGREIQEPDIARTGGRERVPTGIARQERMKGGCADAAPVQLVHLVLHQRNQRRDDNRRAGQEEGGQLKAERFTGTGRHDREDVVPLDHGAHEIFLTGTKRRVAEKALKIREQIDHSRSTGPIDDCEA